MNTPNFLVFAVYMILFSQKNTIQDKVVAKVRKFCYGGTSENDKIHVFSSKNTSMYAIPDQEHENYKSLGKLQCLSDS